jgi:hypothetical protein
MKLRGSPVRWISRFRHPDSAVFEVESNAKCGDIHPDTEEDALQDNWRYIGDNLKGPKDAGNIPIVARVSGVGIDRIAILFEVFSYRLMV